VSNRQCSTSSLTSKRTSSDRTKIKRGDEVGERKVTAASDPAAELVVLHGGFAVPDSNAFGNTFRSALN
jgi:hypothetical protein